MTILQFARTLKEQGINRELRRAYLERAIHGIDAYHKNRQII